MACSPDSFVLHVLLAVALYGQPTKQHLAQQRYDEVGHAGTFEGCLRLGGKRACHHAAAGLALPVHQEDGDVVSLLRVVLRGKRNQHANLAVHLQPVELLELLVVVDQLIVSGRALAYSGRREFPNPDGALACNGRREFPNSFAKLVVPTGGPEAQARSASRMADCHANLSPQAFS